MLKIVKFCFFGFEENDKIMKRMRKRAILLTLSLALTVLLVSVAGSGKALAASDDDVILEGVYMGISVLQA